MPPRMKQQQQQQQRKGKNDPVYEQQQHQQQPHIIMSSSLPSSDIDVSSVTTQLTRYERTHVIGTRAEQIARGAQVFIGDSQADNLSVYEIAERELDEGKLPFIVVRKMPDGSVVHLRLSS